jgi:hypothetical protein
MISSGAAENEVAPALSWYLIILTDGLKVKRMSVLFLVHIFKPPVLNAWKLPPNDC